MLSFREQLKDLQEQAKNGKSTDKNVNSVANEMLQLALGKLRGREGIIIIDIEGFTVNLLPMDSKALLVINYLNPKNFFAFTLMHMEFNDMVYAESILKAIEEILEKEDFRIEHRTPFLFEAYL